MDHGLQAIHSRRILVFEAQNATRARRDGITPVPGPIFQETSRRKERMGDGPKKRSKRGLLTALCLLAAAACSEAVTDPIAEPDPPVEGPVLYNPDWSEASHAKTDPRYDIVFPQDSAGRIDIVMTASQWTSVRSNMTNLWGFDFGAGQQGGSTTAQGDPAYVDVTLMFNGKRWDHVGFRLKGQQSLLFSWRRGVQKLPFRLHFDWFEDDFPGIPDQRMYGFRELSMAPGFSDSSLMRDRLSAEIFRMAGVPAAKTAFYRVYIDFGDGPQYAGLYTMVEVIDNTMIEDQFGEDSGNIYKPESDWRSFKERDFEKKNHGAAADYSDVEAAIATLNDPLRLSDPSAWRIAFEAQFDVDHFLRWLAVGNTIVNADSYGGHARNYYLYRHPTRGLVWIPWDHNQSLEGSPGVSNGPGRGSGNGLTMAMDEVDDRWPLLRYIMDDPVYAARYRALVASFVEDVFTASRVDALVDQYEAVIAPWVVGSEGEQEGFTQLSDAGAFQGGVAELRQHLLDRRALAQQFVLQGR
jgi:spore coat protein H